MGIHRLGGTRNTGTGRRGLSALWRRTSRTPDPVSSAAPGSSAPGPLAFTVALRVEIGPSTFGHSGNGPVPEDVREHVAQIVAAIVVKARMRKAAGLQVHGAYALVSPLTSALAKRAWDLVVEDEALDHADMTDAEHDRREEIARDLAAQVPHFLILLEQL